MYQYILAPSQPKMYQYILALLRPPKMYQYILASYHDDNHTFHAGA